MTEFEYDDDIPEEVLLEIVLDFNRHFAGYVKEVDEELFYRAKDYARSFTEMEGYNISFIDVEDEDEEE
jgi:predicted nuclease of restriction endonuclease-like (RecB) superfamily